MSMEKEGLPRTDPASPETRGRALAWTGITYGFLDPKLESLLRAALEFLRRPATTGEAPGADRGVLRALQQEIDAEPDELRRQHMIGLLRDLRAYFFAPSHENPMTNDGQMLITVSPGALEAYLTVTPPRGSAGMTTINKVRHSLERAQIRHGIDFDVVNRSLEIVREQVNDVVWQALFAKGVRPLPGRSRHLEFSAPVIDKPSLRQDVSRLAQLFSKPWEPVTEGTPIGRIVPAQDGVPGRNVYGEAIEPERPPPVDFDLSDDILLSRGVLTAQAQGYVVADGATAEIVPMYVVENPAPGSLKDVSFPGAMLVKGALHGPGSIDCEDLFVLGNCDRMTLNARGDVFVSGGIVGHDPAVIAADGGVYAGFISEAKLSALGEVVASNAIINSQITSNSRVVVTSDRGLIAGGTIQALREVVARTIGSEFGMLTETVVGRDYLTTTRLEQIVEKIHAHEETLRRIQELKSEFLKARVRVDDLPPDKQELYLGVLRKESQSQSELRSLARRRARLSHQLREFLSASVQVLDSLLPPVRIQIVNEIKEINNRLNAVTIKYDVDHRGIVTSFAQSDRKESS